MIFEQISIILLLAAAGSAFNTLVFFVTYAMSPFESVDKERVKQTVVIKLFGITLWLIFFSMLFAILSVFVGG